MSRFRNSSGVALIDAIVAMLVVGAGMLALAATQLTLTRSADVARQQGEASRLAQLKLEDLRGYTALSSASGVRAWSDLASGTDTVSTNTAYTRTWTFTGSSADPMRAVNVALSWADRSGTAQQLFLCNPLIANAAYRHRTRLDFCIHFVRWLCISVYGQHSLALLSALTAQQ